MPWVTNSLTCSEFRFPKRSLCCVSFFLKKFQSKVNNTHPYRLLSEFLPPPPCQMTFYCSTLQRLQINVRLCLRTDHQHHQSITTALDTERERKEKEVIGISKYIHQIEKKKKKKERNNFLLTSPASVFQRSVFEPLSLMVSRSSDKSISLFFFFLSYTNKKKTFFFPTLT